MFVGKCVTVATHEQIENNKSKPRIAFGSLVEMGILKPGSMLFDQKKKVSAKIMVDGSIKYKHAEGSIHKVAAQIMGTESYNGWTYWHYQDGKNTILIDLCYSFSKIHTVNSKSIFRIESTIRFREGERSGLEDEHSSTRRRRGWR